MVQPDRRGGEPALTRPLVVVSNREPYIHSRSEDGSVTWSPTTGGVSVALDALMRERGGVWIAHGAGDADRLAVDDDDRVRVPPDAPTYDLRRIWLTEAEEHHYYEGFANEGLWPLCHVAHVKPVFRTEDWRVYQSVNRRFAHTVHAELPDVAAPIFVQDYHLTLVPRFLRELRQGGRGGARAPLWGSRGGRPPPRRARCRCAALAAAGSARPRRPAPGSPPG
ncbi:MAG: trehalose-6-phosphate synthase, partial [Acidobacteria bacterium]|nr:trehalose-6-phosphate synthase [Acidobacteriota bacterium]